MPRTRKQDAFIYTAALLGRELPETSRPEPFEPRNKLGMSEAAGQSQILDYLLLLHAQGKLFVARTNNMGVYDPKTGRHRSIAKGVQKGFPDIFVAMTGRMIFLEVKSSVGYQSDDQVIVQRLLEAQGAEYYIVRTADYVKKIIEKVAPLTAN